MPHTMPRKRSGSAKRSDVCSGCRQPRSPTPAIWTESEHRESECSLACTTRCPLVTRAALQLRNRAYRYREPHQFAVCDESPAYAAGDAKRAASACALSRRALATAGDSMTGAVEREREARSEPSCAESHHAPERIPTPDCNEDRHSRGFCSFTVARGSELRYPHPPLQLRPLQGCPCDVSAPTECS